jgi:flavodoxin
MAKVSILFLSKYGNGKMAMESLNELLAKEGHEVQMFSVADHSPDQVPDSDLYVFSTPVHMGKLPGKMRKYAKKFRPKRKGGRYALVVTHASEPEGERWSPTRTVETMNELLGLAGMDRARDEVLIRVKDMKGPLEDGWEDKVKTLAEDISNLI